MLLAGSVSALAMEWNGLFLAGDDSIAAFDNSQEGVVAALRERGLATATRLTVSRRLAKANPEIDLLTEQRLDTLWERPIAAPGEGCLVHLTSHGAEGEGFYLALDGDTYLASDDLAQLLDDVCGASERTVLISACFSGQIITDAIKRPNRIILTAARADRPSFGCSADDTYTYWDGCLIEHLPRAKTWARLYDDVSACIDEKEAAIGALPSEPQAWFGAETRGWRVLQ
jgi:hypothetical protein